MEKPFDKEVLLRYLREKQSPEDEQLVRSWFKEPDSFQLDLFIRQNWQEFAETKSDKDLSHILRKIERRIIQEKYTNRNVFWSYYRQIAAVILVPVLLVSAYFFMGRNQQNGEDGWAEIYSPVGARTEFSLPDGTKGWLNSASSIRYPVRFRDREVKISGEAYFDVVHDKNRPFIVSTPFLNVMVLGTRFNVSAYPEDSFTKVVLEEGKVRLNSTKGSFSAELSPDECFILKGDDQEGTLTNVDPGVHSSWKEGKLIFRDEPLSQVLKKIGRWYNVQFVVENQELNDYIYKATFQDETLDEVIRLLALTSPIKYEIIERKPGADGAYPVRKIIIKRKV
ncbi:MAG: FecR domain-containing protein [Prolixibacteraceae bacterium]